MRAWRNVAVHVVTGLPPYLDEPLVEHGLRLEVRRLVPDQRQVPLRTHTRGRASIPTLTEAPIPPQKKSNIKSRRTSPPARATKLRALADLEAAAAERRRDFPAEKGAGQRQGRLRRRGDGHLRGGERRRGRGDGEGARHGRGLSRSRRAGVWALGVMRWGGRGRALIWCRNLFQPSSFGLETRSRLLLSAHLQKTAFVLLSTEHIFSAQKIERDITFPPHEK